MKTYAAFQETEQGSAWDCQGPLPEWPAVSGQSSAVVVQFMQ
jgi:hypothetical protein